ncbi:type I polyketide synthase [Streptomyces sp. S.PNR 29]|uniref:type I polyketide synthase n=1 Tax=Streptomyces sp. S.PNR 29 TaxID=2973805 RepID=UPI0025B0BB16|nr:type I polyketide synthase [Streptomyces sp. S.PNR 29]MDN0197605.1 SDR family NAD(P)-dependent oxidoreductase [Streptomyces sp. S.PNR 29]
MAIIGMAGRFPGAADLEEFWRNLRDGVESIVPLTDEELTAAGVPPEVFHRPDFVKAGPRFKGAGLFDAEFFGYTAREAELMDPQHRLFLETAWQALENAGYDSAQYDGSIGVFGGAGANRYVQHVYAQRDLAETVGLTQILLGNELGFLATRVSYKLDLKGPSVSLRTACSTSLVAVHTACRSLIAGDCDMALSGGVHVDPAQGAGYLHQEGSFLSPDGHVRPFDAQARGTVFGSGVGVVVLKRLEDALADGDTVHAVIKGSAVNNDGAVKVGFTAPSVTGQAEAIGAALADAGLTPGDIDYVEAHGTGTSLGDPIEVQALERAFGGAGRCALGSVKGNIGHLDAAAGMAGLLKTVLALTHQAIPPTLNHHTPNPDIDFTHNPFHIPTTLTPWPRTHRPRRAGISAFGFGGTNAHLILEEPPPPTPTTPSPRTTETLILSARTPQALEQATDQLAHHLRTHQPDLADTAHTLARGRHPFPHRRTVTGTDPHTIATALETRDPTHTTTHHTPHDNPPIVFLYTGQGSQHPHMAHGLYDHHPTFRHAIDQCATHLTDHLDTDIRDILWNPDHQHLLHHTQYTQPALFTLEYALTQLWQSWGITPHALIGHSLGEWVAATIAGIFTLPDALKLITLRAQLMQNQPPGTMLHVLADRDSVQAALPEDASLAAHNGPRDCIISGPPHTIDHFTTHAHQRGWTTQTITTQHAFHSPLMDPVITPFTNAVKNTPRKPPTTPLISNITGQWLTPQQATDPHYWAHHIRATVEFTTGITTTHQHPATLYLEIGPGHTLTNLTRRTLTTTKNTKPKTHTTLPHPQTNHTPTHHIQQTLHHLWLNGATPNWTTYYQPEHRHRIPLPTHPLNPKHHWINKTTPQSTHPSPRTPGTSPRRRDDISAWFYAPSWQRVSLPSGAAPEPGRHWLVFADDLGVGEGLVQRLRAGGATVSVVRPAAAWSRPDPGRFTLDPARGDDYDRLIDALRNGPSGLPTHIVHGWAVTAMDETELADPATGLRLGFESLVRLAQALARHAVSEQCRFWVLSNGLHNVTGSERLSPSKATLLGPCRVLPREMAGAGCCSIDLDCLAAPAPHQLDQLMAELASEPAPGTATVAHRGIHRWLLHYLPQRLPTAGTGTALRPDGVYLITGGTGGLGLALARHITAAGGRVALTSRTRLPPPEEWDAFLAGHPAGGPLVDVVRHLGRLRDTGAQMLVLQADVSDPEAMRVAVERTVSRWGAVHGVFHAAGVAGGGLMQLKDLSAAAEVMRPKVHGTLALEEALSDQELDFLVLFGSNGANIGSAGQVDYCAANCFLDAFAQDRGRRQRVISIDWGPWKGTGMAVSTALPPGLEERRRRDVEERGMTAEEGLLALETILATAPEPQIIVSPSDLEELFADAFSLEGADERTREHPPRPGDMSDAAHTRPDIPTEYVPPRTPVEHAICEVWQDLLGIDKVGVQDSFFDLGGNSLVAIQLISSTNARLHARLTLGDLYEGLTVAHLAELVDNHAQPAPDPLPTVVERRAENRQKRRQYQQQRRKARGQ